MCLGGGKGEWGGGGGGVEREEGRRNPERERVTNVELQREEGWLVGLGHRGATTPLTFAERFDFHT